MSLTGPGQWVWMPHAGHFICGHYCRFHLNTKVGSYIVSSVGEHWPDSSVRKIFARSRGVELPGIGDELDMAYFEKFGFEDIGYQRKYETMVFLAEAAPEETCCPWRAVFDEELDMAGYNESRAAYEGHLAMCHKWSRK